MLICTQFFLPWRNSHRGPRPRIEDSWWQTHHTRYDSSERVISLTHIPLFDNTQHSNRQASMPLAGFGPTIPASERSQTHALNRAAAVFSNMYPLNILLLLLLSTLLLLLLTYSHFWTSACLQTFTYPRLSKGIGSVGGKKFSLSPKVKGHFSYYMIRLY